MTTLAAPAAIDQHAIAKNLGFAQNQLFQSTNQAIDFWLEALKKTGNITQKRIFRIFGFIRMEQP